MVIGEFAARKHPPSPLSDPEIQTHFPEDAENIIAGCKSAASPDKTQCTSAGQWIGLSDRYRLDAVLGKVPSESCTAAGTKNWKDRLT